MDDKVSKIRQISASAYGSRYRTYISALKRGRGTTPLPEILPATNRNLKLDGRDKRIRVG